MSGPDGSCCESSEEKEEEEEEELKVIEKPGPTMKQQKIVLKVGWLFKFNSFFPLQWWSKYWFVLNQFTCSLSYFQNPTSPKKIKIFPMFEVQIQVGLEIKTRARLPMFLTKEGLIKLRRNRKTLLLCCDDEVTTKEWTDALYHFSPRDKRTCIFLDAEDERSNEAYVPHISLGHFCNPYVDFNVMVELEKANLKHDREFPEHKFTTPLCFLCDKRTMIQPLNKFAFVKSGKEIVRKTLPEELSGEKIAKKSKRKRTWVKQEKPNLGRILKKSM